MDFVVELLIQLVVQVVVELIAEWLLEVSCRTLGRALKSQTGLYVISVLIGLGFGFFWGKHLSGQAHWPKLLWISLALAALGLGTAARRWATSYEGPMSSFGTDVAAQPQAWRAALLAPWRWPAPRLFGFALLNLAIAAGIGVGFRPPR